MAKKIAVGFVIYNPNVDQINRILEASHLGFCVYIHDNSPEKFNTREFAKNKKNIVYLTCGKNVGLGIGMCSVCSQAFYDNYPALVFFDQDSVFSLETLDAIEKFYCNNLHLLNDYCAVNFNSNKYVNDLTDCNCFDDVSIVINSGSLFLLDNLKKMNWHNDKYFIDGVDYEFCLNAQVNKFKIGRYSCIPGFDHESEQGNKQYNIFTKSISIRKYNLTRIMDVLCSYTKIILKSLYKGKIKYAVTIIRLLVIYVITQLLVRIIK